MRARRSTPAPDDPDAPPAPSPPPPPPPPPTKPPARHAGWVLLSVLALLGLYVYSTTERGPLLRRSQHLLPFVSTSRGPSSTAASSGQGQQQQGPLSLSAAAHPLSVCAAGALPAMSSAGQPLRQQYSLWAMPQGRVGQQLRAEVAHLAERHGVQGFPPHTTVLGDIERPGGKEEVLALAAELAKQVKKYRINFVDVTRGSIFYQCVYLSIAKDEGTMAAAATARQVFDMTTGPYMPHLSLLYSDMPAEERAKVVEYETARLYGESSGYDTLLVENGYEVDRLAVWYTPVGDTSLQSWCMVGEFELA